jgi:hypothetical protein
MSVSKTTLYILELEKNKRNQRLYKKRKESKCKISLEKYKEKISSCYHYPGEGHNPYCIEYNGQNILYEMKTHLSNINSHNIYDECLPPNFVIQDRWLNTQEEKNIAREIKSFI